MRKKITASRERMVPAGSEKNLPPYPMEGLLELKPRRPSVTARPDQQGLGSITEEHLRMVRNFGGRVVSRVRDE